jgi:hypothetical protein
MPSLGLTMPQSIVPRADEVKRFRSAKQLDGRRPRWVIGYLCTSETGDLMPVLAGSGRSDFAI